MNSPLQLQEREDDVRAQLEHGCSGACMRLIVSPGSGCTWADHWYVDAARKVKSQFGSAVRCVLQWTSDFEAIDHRAHPYDWKAVLLESQLRHGDSDNVILVGHSSGGNAALQVVQRSPVAALVVIGAGYSQWDRQHGGIPPWDYDAIVGNVRKRIVVLHGTDDHVISCSEGSAIAQGLRAAAARRGAAGPPQLDVRTSEAGVGHAMQELCPAALLQVVTAVARELSQE
jgi:pimeloyl-ACP methyl ester carboxylesterase